ncbi:MAG: hypothetical protein U0572_08580 [Phycisphaerales bacterium]
MSIRTSIQPRILYGKPIYAAVCLAMGIWGWYDYAITIPRMENAVAEHAQLTARKDELTAKRASGGTLSTAEIADYERVSAELATRFKEAPTPPASYDRAVQLWLYIIGCGVLGPPMFLWPLFQAMRRKYELDDDGTLRLPEGTCNIDEIKSIDMSRWMSKSIATVTLPNGATSTLDDYQFKNLHLIVGAIAHRLHPDEWTSEAKQVKAKPAESDAASQDATTPS